MTIPIEYVDELDPFLSIELPDGWVRALVKHPLQAVDGEPTELDQIFARDLSPSLPDEPRSTKMLFVYLDGYDPSTDRPMDHERKIKIGYFDSADIHEMALGYDEYQDIQPDELNDCYALESGFDEGIVISADEVEEWLTRVIPKVEDEMDAWRELWVVLSDIDGLGKAGIGNLFDEYGTIGSIKDATEAELVEIAYVTEDLAPAVLTACDQWDGTVPEAPGNKAARRADDPLAIDDSQLRPFTDLFNE